MQNCQLFRGVGLGLLGFTLFALALTAEDARAQGPVLAVKATAGVTSPDWVQVPSVDLSSTSLSATVENSPIGGSAPCGISGPNWSWMPAAVGGCAAWIDHPDPNSPNATLYCSFTEGAYWTVNCTATVSYNNGCGGAWSASGACVANPKSVELVDLKVTGAQKAGATDESNWGAIKKADAKVTLEATTKPDTEDAAANITWTGGDTVKDTNKQRTVSRAASAKTVMQAKIGTVEKAKSIWVLWATVEVKTKEKTPALAAQLKTIPDGTDNLGAVTWKTKDGVMQARGKICAVATITPAGAGAVFTTGWGCHRSRWCHDFENGAKDSPYDTDWVDDTSDAPWKVETPDANDMIYDVDGPNMIGSAPTSMVTTMERYANFAQYVKWNGEFASSSAYWYYQARWEKAKNPQITLNEVSTGALNPLPDKSSFAP